MDVVAIDDVGLSAAKLKRKADDSLMPDAAPGQRLLFCSETCVIFCDLFVFLTVCLQLTLLHPREKDRKLQVVCNRRN